jgi:hypothetical protein
MSAPDRLAEIDGRYVANQTLLDDLMIIARTVAGGGSGDGPTLALQLQLIEGSESMGDHDSGSDDWWCVG